MTVRSSTGHEWKSKTQQVRIFSRARAVKVLRSCLTLNCAEGGPTGFLYFFKITDLVTQIPEEMNNLGKHFDFLN